MNQFIDNRKDNWKRLEELLANLRGTSLRGLSKIEVREFGELYRRVATDLAIARSETRDPKLINYLNSLVIRAHGKIYRAQGDGFGTIGKFFAREFPNAIRRNLRYFVIAFSVFLAFAIFSFVMCGYDTNFGTLIGLDDIRFAAQSDHRWWLSLNEANQKGSSQILTNNIQVSIMAFAFGVFFGVGTLYILAMNGILIGGVLGICFRENPPFGSDLVTFMIGHGVLELSAIFIAGGAGMMIGYRLIDPGDLSRAQALKKAGKEAARIVIGSACILFVAGLIEGFISPSGLPPMFKYAVGLTTGILLFSYLGFVGRGAESKADDEIQSVT